MNKSPIDVFWKFFRIVASHTPELLAESYKLRYQVYCLENGFEDTDRHPNGQEIDEFDVRSEHYLIQHKQTGKFVATTRIILPNHQNLMQSFPIEDNTHIEPSNIVRSIPRNQLAEISRFCVSKAFKQFQNPENLNHGISSHRDSTPQYTEHLRLSFPYITLALISGMIRSNHKHGITHWYAVMKPALFRYLQQFGIYFTPIGPVSNYHGLRIPCIIEVEYLLESVRRKNPQVYELLLGRAPAFLHENQLQVLNSRTPLHHGHNNARPQHLSQFKYSRHKVAAR